MMNTAIRILVVILCTTATIGLVSATELGINYYHESMMSDQWKVPYINGHTIEQARTDFDEMSEITRHVKFYLNPFVDGNDQWVAQLTEEAEARGFYTVINEMVDDRDLGDWNWQSYKQKVLDDCSYFSGKADEILIGNEVSLHSPWNKYTIRSKMEELINECKPRFDGPVSYEAFWYEKEAWYDYQGHIYFMQYENVNSFKTNVDEMQDRFGDKAYVGEWGEDLYDEGVHKDDWWQRESIEDRWNHMQTTDTPVAYLFAYREPSWNGFGLIRPDGIKRPMWDLFPQVGDTPPPPPPNDDPDPTPSGEGELTELTVTCEAPGCSVNRDITDSTCRYVDHNTNSGLVKTSACKQSNGEIHIYRNSAPSNLVFSVCYDGVCVSNSDGFSILEEDEPPVDEPSDPTGGIGDFSTSCDAQSSCTKTSDVTSGVCRTVIYNTNSGDIKVYACEKDGNYIEAYRQQAPSNYDYEVCVANACINQDNGFARVIAEDNTPDEPDEPNDEPWEYDGIGSLSVSCEATGTSCDKNSDVTSGSCRTVEWGTNQGTLKIQTCDKNNGKAEIYTTQRPSNLEFSACVEHACVTEDNGFAVLYLNEVGDEPNDDPDEPNDPPPSEDYTLASLPFSVSPSGDKLKDETSGVCRFVGYQTSVGWIEAQTCDKGSSFEMYLKTPGVQANICVDDACVGTTGGFAVI